MTTITDICDIVQRNVRASAGAEDTVVEPDTELLLTGLLDSLTIMKIVTEIEKAAGISFPDDAIVAANFRSPNQLHSLVARIG
ncbi:phosphopantetheine-binding protein [Nocardia pseudobrasiliensis]|uniref:Acyl carrier protein n=1 Tax=Nocardia pseudobrasiliensis TaxID=45979 RepID=A0A370I495_9NOCA|nr:phosphopantetheine-binding protein [Nocardia pseudobrasiliensis]RDI65556.1 acyl carrier protein [Nocardia pseudobrasiliensis]